MKKLKCWKVEKNESTWKIWKKDSKSSYHGNDRVFVAKMYADKVIANPGKQKYVWVSNYGEIPNTQSKVFLSKQKAESFAYKYMKEHC